MKRDTDRYSGDERYVARFQALSLGLVREDWRTSCGRSRGLDPPCVEIVDLRSAAGNDDYLDSTETDRTGGDEIEDQDLQKKRG